MPTYCYHHAYCTSPAHIPRRLYITPVLLPFPSAYHSHHTAYHLHTAITLFPVLHTLGGLGWTDSTHHILCTYTPTLPVFHSFLFCTLLLHLLILHTHTIPPPTCRQRKGRSLVFLPFVLGWDHHHWVYYSHLIPATTVPGAWSHSYPPTDFHTTHCSSFGFSHHHLRFYSLYSGLPSPWLFWNPAILSLSFPSHTIHTYGHSFL